MAQPNISFDPQIPSAAEPLLPTEAAYQQLLPELSAIPDTDLLSLNLDVMAAVTTVTGALPEIVALRPRIEAELRNFDFVQFDKLGLYAQALAHANTVHRRSTTPKTSVQELVAELTTLRDRMLGNAQSLAQLGLFDAGELRSVKTVSGHRALATDVLTITGVFKHNGAALQGKTPYTQAEQLRAGNLAWQLINALGLREQTPVVAGEAALMRLKAFTAFVRCYEAARRAVQYVRPRDASSIAPSLYAGRRRRGAEDEVTPAEEVAGAPAPPTGAFVINNTAGLPIDNPFSE